MNKRGITKEEFYDLSALTVKMNERIAHHLVEHLDTDLTKIQIAIMMEISQNQPLSITELSDRLNMNYGNTSSQCKVLETKSYILRKRDEADERYVKLSISQKGQAIVEQIDQWLENFLSKVSALYSADEWEELFHFTKAFKEMVQQSIQLLEGED